MLHTSVLLLCGVVLIATTISDAQSVLNHPDLSISVIPKGCPCPKIIKPVCGINGHAQQKTFLNNCLLQCARRFSQPNLQLLCNGRCPCQRSNTVRGKRALDAVSSPVDFASCSCMTLYAPVCGSDSITYSNSCFLGCESLRNPDLTQVKTGPC